MLYYLPFVLLWLPLASAWSFNISSRVVQCADLSVAWDGGVAPWELVLIPVGALSGPEIRTIVDANITSGNSYSFQLKFPTNSSFLAMMSDATGIGTGGTSELITVLDGSADCLATSATTPDFYLYLDPNSSPAQCSTVDVGWDATNSQGPVRITAMLPGGQSFALPVPNTGASFNWTVDMKQGTDYLIVAGDQRGFGTGGSSQLFTVGAGSSGCINGSSPSSTMGPAAGGIYATGSGGGSVTGVPGGQPAASTGGTSSGKKSNTGAIVGGVIGGVIFLLFALLSLLYFLRRRRRRQTEGGGEKNRRREDIDLLNGEAGSTSGSGGGAGRTGEEAALAGAAGAAVAAPSRDSRGGNGEMSEFGGRASFSSATGTDATGLAAPLSASSRRDRVSSAPSLPPLNFGSGISSNGRPSTDLSQTEVSQPTATRTSSGVPPSAFFNASNNMRPTTPTTTSDARRSGGAGKGGAAPRTMRPVNVIVHDDGGAAQQPEGSSSSPNGEVVELPPSYSDVRRNSSPPAAKS
ncbi:hypothetical protein FRB96_009235 [Tulasnella sp. 330]|nr:hypothetical protein FRB96_009235 [Tulasnella sp. 330]KAG8881397.1 hypothetical protein FRB98_004377 [Tulasnella sp. 332]